MPTPIKDTLDSVLSFLSDSIVPLAIAVFGGLVNAMNNKPEKWSWKWFLTGLATAAFCGIVVNCGLADVSMPEKLKIAIVGMSGYASNDFLVVLKKRLINLAEKEEE